MHATITNRLLAPAAIQRRDNHVLSIDLPAVVARLLLFETYILQSIRFEELPFLIQTFGDGLEQLLQAGALKIHFESYTIGQLAQVRNEILVARSIKPLPLGFYSFSPVRIHEQEKITQRALDPLSPQLRDAVLANSLEMPTDFSSKVFEGFYSDLRSNKSAVDASIRAELKRRGINPKKLKIQMQEAEPEDFHVETNLSSEYGLSKEDAHRAVERGLLALGGLNKRIAEMMVYSTLSGVGQEDLFLLQGKLALLGKLVESNNMEQRLERIVDVLGLQVPVFGETKIDASKLLKIRESDDCRAFRDWLSHIDSLSDQQLKERVHGLNSRVREALNSRAGKAVRFLVSNGLGLLPGINLMAILGVSMIDSFVLERLAPKDAIISFLSDSYPSLFKEQSMDSGIK